MASDPSADAAVAAAAALFARARDRVCEVVRGKDDVVELALVAVAASGHLLLEDVPGVGKTTLATALASAIGGSLRRIQFTSDLLPGDITGVNVLDADRGGFTFRPGPLFGNVVLADEINRATPKTQSALLEAMSERRVTVDGHSHPLPDRFTVLSRTPSATAPSRCGQPARSLPAAPEHGLPGPGARAGHPARAVYGGPARAGPEPRGHPDPLRRGRPGDPARRGGGLPARPRPGDPLGCALHPRRLDPWRRGVAPRQPRAGGVPGPVLRHPRGPPPAGHAGAGPPARPRSGGDRDGAQEAVREVLWELPSPTWGADHPAHPAAGAGAPRGRA